VTEASDRGRERTETDRGEPAVGLRGHHGDVTEAPTELVPNAEWQRLDPRMLLVHPVREVIKFLPVLLGLFVASSASGGPPWQYLGVLVPIALGVLRYLTTRFRIAQGRVELSRGLLNRHVLSTRLDRVRTVDVTASLIHRVLGLATVRIGTGTASTDSDERLDLDGLPAGRARGLRAELLHVAPMPDAADAAPVPAPEERIVLRFSPGWARFAPLTSSGAVIAAGLFGGGAQLLNELGAFTRVDTRDWSLDIPVWVGVVVAALVLVVGVAVLSVAGYLLTNWDFRLSHTPGSWHLSRGLLTTRETSIDDERLAGVTLAEPLSLRLAGAARLSAIVTGLGSEGSSSVLAPPAPREVVTGVAGRVLDTEAPVESALVGHGPAAARRRYSRAMVPALTLLVVVIAAVVAAGWSWWLLSVPAALVVAATAVAADRVRSLGHALTDGYVVSRSGSLNRRREALEVDHVIGWTFRSSLFQRRAGLTTLIATTAGGRQSVTMLDVPEARAVELARLALPELTSSFERPD
jgi:putative membrane protein